MKRRLFRIDADRAREKTLRRHVRAVLRLRRAVDADYKHAWEREVRRRPATMSRLEHARFLLWHRQFEGRGLPGVKLVIGAARSTARRLVPMLNWVRAPA